MLQLDGSTRQAVLLGMLVGDALGVPYEFQSPDALPPHQLLEFTPPAGFRRSHGRVPPGTWSDDGALALALLDSLRHYPGLDLEHFARAMVSWHSEGHYTPDGVVFDIGIQTSSAFERLRRGVPAVSSGGAGEHQNGNGSLMRALSCLLVPAQDSAALVDRAMRQSLPTHAHPRSTVACALLVLTGWHLAAGEQPETALSEAQRYLHGHLLESQPQSKELDVLLQARQQTPGGSGYVVDSFWSAWHALTVSSDYEACVRTAVALGNDTDTTACIAGGLAGARWGLDSLPERWLSGLQGRELALGLLSPV